MNQENRARLKLVAIVMLFVVPVAAAYILYFTMSGLAPSGESNQGELLDPVQPLPSLQLTGRDGAVTSADVLAEKWTFLQVAPEGCGDECRTSLDETLQIWRLLGDKKPRVQRVLLVGDGKRAPDPGRKPLSVYQGQLAAIWQLIEQHAAGRPGTVYLVDPHGNWVLFYPPEQDGTELYKDTKHLLSLSYIG